MIITIETVNWNTTRIPLSVFDIEPGLKVPFKTCTGLKDARTKAGYAPATVPTRITIEISPRIPLYPENNFKDISLPIRWLKAGASTSNSNEAIIAAIVTIIKDSPIN
jgi:hypothetical protein